MAALSVLTEISFSGIFAPSKNSWLVSCANEIFSRKLCVTISASRQDTRLSMFRGNTVKKVTEKSYIN